MKKSYETPSVEKIKFNYRDQVVAASGDPIVQDPSVESGTNYNNSYGQCFTVGDVVGDIISMTFWDLCNLLG